ncbi:MAG TPA: hypothetical protein VN455_06580 [Methanotrichaceae archaeon]|nr:hypothetical protein [Methanotrichaceae archaeon]
MSDWLDEVIEIDLVASYKDGGQGFISGVRIEDLKRFLRNRMKPRS